MKKYLIAFLAVAIMAFAASANAQEKYVAGGFEASGHVVTGFGYQHATGFQNAVTSGYVTRDGDNTYYAGPMGKYLPALPAQYQDNFTFFVDEVELDLMKYFGENIRLRADLDFARAASGSANTAAFNLEQAYATANIPIGNGVEFLIGRFNTPMGFESVDVAYNDTISKSPLVTGLRPSNTTGVKFYYAFNDLVDLHFYAVNTLTQDSNVKVTDLPSVGARLGFNWGEEGTESTIGVSPFFGPETRISKKHFTFGGDIDFNWWVTEAFALGGEVLFRRDDLDPGYLATASNSENMAGLLNLHYVFSDVWDGTLKYAFAKQYDVTNVNGQAWTNLTGAEQSIHQLALAGGYGIADGATLKAEGRFDMINPAGASNTEYHYGLAMAFVYNF